MPLKYRGGDEPRQTGVKKCLNELREEGIKLCDLTSETDIEDVPHHRHFVIKDIKDPGSTRR